MTVYMFLWSLGSSLNALPAGAYALIGTVIGTLGLRALESWLSRNADKSAIRRDLNEEISSLQARLDVVDEEVSEYRRRAFSAEEMVALLRIMILKLGGELPEEQIERIKQATKSDDAP